MNDNSPDRGEANDRPPMAAAVSMAVLNAHYPRMVAMADTARTRAQNAYAIFSAAAGALALGLAANVQSSWPGARWCGLVAIVMLLATAAMYIQIVASPMPRQKTTDREPDDIEITEEKGAGAAAYRVMDYLASERVHIEKTTSIASKFALAALAAAAVALASLLIPGEETTVQGTIQLTDTGATAVQAVCPKATRALHGQVAKSSIGTDFVVIDVAGDLCAGRTSQIDVPKEQVEAIVLDR